MTTIQPMIDLEQSTLPVLHNDPSGSLIQQLASELTILAVAVVWSGIGIMAGLLLALLLCVMSVPCDPMSAMVVSGSLSGTAGALLEMNVW